MKHSETQTSNNGLTEIQKENLEALMGLEFSGWSLCEMYLGAIRVLDNPNNPDRIPQAAHSLRELLEKLPPTLGIEDPRTSTDCKQKGIARKEQIDQTFDKSDPLYVLVKNRSYSNQLFCKRIRLLAIAHHTSLTANYSSQCQQDFEEFDQLLNNLLAQVTEENQAKIKKILEITEPTLDDITELIKLIRIKGANFNYFFKEVTDPIWLDPLRDNGIFDNPPEMDGNQFVPNWEPINYLEKISNQKPEQVVEIICSFKKTKNPKILRRILAIACKLDNIDLSLKLKPMVLDFLNHHLDRYYETEDIITVLNKWGSCKKGQNAAIDIVKSITAFQETLNSNKNHPKPSIRNYPKPRIYKRGYEEILSRGVRTVAYHAPFKVASALIKTVKATIKKCGKPQDGEPQPFDKSFSKIWFPRLDQPTWEHKGESEILLNTLTYACEQVYIKDPEQIDKLDQELRKCRLWTFERLRHHLYASFPTKQTLPWIKEAICEYEDYSTYEHPYEFQMMIRKSCELYGCSLLSREKRKEIFNDIKAGPQSPTSQHLNTGIDFVFKAKQRQFHYKQLRPFKEVLFGEFQNYFRLLDSEQTDPLTDDSYIHPISINDSDEIVSFQTPKSVDDLKDFNDQELLDYINSWEEEEQVDQNLKKESISELADTFQSFFTDIIVPEDLRLSFWMNNRTRIKHPIYVKSIVQGITEIVHRKDFTRLNDLIDFCDWVLSLLDTDPGLVENEQEKISPDHSDFVPLLNAVINFIKEGINSDLPISARQGIACLLDKVCNQANASNANNELNFYCNEIDDINDLIHEKFGFDSKFYIRGVPYSLNQLNKTINEYRSKALELLIINYWKWVRRHLPKDIVPEVTQILIKRIIPEAKIPLSDSEYAILGRYFFHLYNNYPDWSSKYREYIFPHENKSSWRCSFENYLKHNPALIIMKDEYDYALENLDIFCEKNKQSKAIESLGMHIFNLYLLEAYDLRSEESLLNKFYSTLTDSHYKKHLFDMVGCCVWHGEFNEFIPKVVDFLNWRLNEGSIQEFHEFSWWMKSDCLDSDLRLRSYLQILSLIRDKNLNYVIELRDILNLHQINELLVIKCLAKIAQLTPDNHRFSICDLNDLVSILNKSLNSTDPKILNTAKVAKESFLRAGTIDLNLFGDDIPSTRN